MKINRKLFATAFIILLTQTLLLGQGIQKKVIIDWKGAQNIQGIDYENVKALYADGLSNNPAKNYTPEYFEKFTLPANIGSCDILVSHTEWEPVAAEQINSLTYTLQPDETLTPLIETGTERGVNMAMLTLVPLVINPDGGIMRLKSFTLDLIYIPAKSTESLKSKTYAPHSVLAQGNWYKIQLDKTGVYKLTYSEIQAMGVDMATVNPAHIRLFGNGGGMLPEANSIPRYDDLDENQIQVVSANPNVFAPGDYMLFYGTAPNTIFYNKTSHKFEHSLNLYSDFTYYFLNFDGSAGLRIGDQQQSSLTPNYTCSSFTEGIFYEKDKLNFINSGKEWVGERMDPSTQVFELPEFTFPNLIQGKQSWIRYRVTSRASTVASFTVKVNGTKVSEPACSAFGNYNYATDRTETKSFFPDNDKIKVSFQYNGTGNAIGWLDWVELNIPRDLNFTGGQMAFADPYSVMPGFVSEFLLQGSSANVTIWEVTDPAKVNRITADHIQGGVSRFVLNTDSLRQFVAWDNTSFLTPTFTEKVIDQDLHGIASADLLIITHKDYLDEANRLAAHHRIVDGMKVTVATNEQVYNEFSSGSPDIVAIRDFAGMLYNRSDAGNKLQYLLLFGDGSFDYKDRVPSNTNRVLTFQTKESLNSVYSYASDDFFGILDPNEGNDAVGLIDIGIGRFPVSTPDQAKVAVDKSIFYAGNSEASLTDWRNKLCFVSDDGNGNTHFRQVEKQIFPLVDAIAPIYNVNKIYLDAFKQISTPSGQRCPDVNAAIKSNVENGVLVLSYTGHGGETGWADESILSVREIDAWTNYNNMPVFMTATCEFSRYDDPARVSAGEHVFLNPLGGGIALFTTTRLANAGTNIGLTLYFYDTLFSKISGQYPRFGDVIAYSKNKIGGNDASLIRNFVLLGDPALRLAYPKYNVITTQINGQDLGQLPDTIAAMTPVEIKGIVADESGNKLSGFNGIMDVKVFDKPRTLTTLGSEPGDWPDKFTVQDNYIYQGRATVTNGDFTVNFIVPRDIDYSYGFGKISYYAHDGTTDANGYCKQLVIGGSGNESSDNAGPQISLFIDNTNFKSGGRTGDSPLLIAQLSDESGINTISNAIGHDIVATIDGDNSASVMLNSFYSADLDSYRSGVVNYKFSQLAEGSHTLTLKAWDVFNNSSEATITFTVSKNQQITVTDMNVYPNPFSNEVKVDFNVNLFDTPIQAYLEVFNINGSLVSTTDSKLLLSQGYKGGTLNWDGRNVSGSTVPPGVYLLSIRVKNGSSETVKAARLIKLR